MPIDQDEAAQADRNVDEENHAPMKVADDGAAEYRSQHGADQSRNGDKAHGIDELGFRKGTHHGDAAHRNHHGAAAALQDAARHQQVNVAGNSAEQRAERKDADR